MYYSIHQLDGRVFAVDSDNDPESYFLESLPGLVTLGSYLSVFETRSIFDTLKALGFTDEPSRPTKNLPSCIVTRGELFNPVGVKKMYIRHAIHDTNLKLVFTYIETLETFTSFIVSVYKNDKLLFSLDAVFTSFTDALEHLKTKHSSIPTENLTNHDVLWACLPETIKGVIHHD